MLRGVGREQRVDGVQLPGQHHLLDRGRMPDVRQRITLHEGEIRLRPGPYDAQLVLQRQPLGRIAGSRRQRLVRREAARDHRPQIRMERDRDVVQRSVRTRDHQAATPMDAQHHVDVAGQQSPRGDPGRTRGRADLRLQRGVLPGWEQRGGPPVGEQRRVVDMCHRRVEERGRDR